MDYSIYENLANTLRVISHPIRLCILGGLILKGESNVKTIQETLNASQSSISQHLGKLKAAKIIDSRRVHNQVFYFVTNEKIKDFLISALRIR